MIRICFALLNIWALLQAKSAVKIEIKTYHYSDNTPSDRSSHLSLTLRWRGIIYGGCNIVPNKSISHYSCPFDALDTNETYSFNSGLFNDDGIQLIYKSESFIFIKMIKIWEFDENNNKNVSYEINAFCSSQTYELLLHQTSTIIPVISSHWGDYCKSNFGDYQYTFRKFNSIGIGKKSKFVIHNFKFIDNIYDHKNEEMECLVLPPQPLSISVKTANYTQDYNPQTRDPVHLRLIWFDKVYNCTIYPVQPDLIYSCNVSNESTQIFDVSIKYYDTFILYIGKDEKLRNSFVLDKVIINTINGFYSIDSFCISYGMKHRSRICGKNHIKLNNRCSGYIDDIHPPDYYFKCDGVGIDTDSKWRTELFIEFPNNLFLYPNDVFTTQHSKVINADADDNLIRMQSIESNPLTTFPPDTTYAYESGNESGTSISPVTNSTLVESWELYRPQMSKLLDENMDIIIAFAVLGITMLIINIVTIIVCCRYERNTAMNKRIILAENPESYSDPKDPEISRTPTPYTFDHPSNSSKHVQ